MTANTTAGPASPPPQRRPSPPRGGDPTAPPPGGLNRNLAHLRVAERMADQGLPLRQIADAVGFVSIAALASLAARHRRPDLALRWNVTAGRPCVGCGVGLAARDVWTVDHHGSWCHWCWRVIRCKTCGAPMATVTDRGHAYYVCVPCGTERLAA